MSANQPELQIATCAVCGEPISFQQNLAHREAQICGGCGSCPRFCGLALAVSRTVWREADRPLAQQPPRRDLVAIGISDDDRLARVFSEKFLYQNTRFHSEPYLDLCSAESCDLSFALDVIEHTIEPPVVPLKHLFSILKPGGTLILSVPTYLCPSTIEWYGGAERIEIDQIRGSHSVRWRNKRRTEYIDDNPVFHGGPGSVLEMRIISHSELLSIARALGLVADSLPFAPEWGYFWPIVRHSPYLPECADARVIVMSRPIESASK
jgi:hypothetical protein